MKNIKNFDIIIHHYKDWKTSDIAFIKEFAWSKNNLRITFYFQIRSMVNGWPDLSKDFVETTFKFENVNNMQLNFVGSGLHFVSGFNIIDTSDHGLENINFFVEDYENGSIEFGCENIEIVSIEEPQLLSNNSF